MKGGREPLRLLVDTNIWLDYFLERRECNMALAAIHRAYEMGDLMAVTPTITKDVFFITSASLKKRMREEGLEISNGLGKGSNAVAWECLKTMQKLTLVLNVGMLEHVGAMFLGSEYPDYEDDLLIATARNAKIDHIITNDKGLLKSAKTLALTPQEYLELDHG